MSSVLLMGLAAGLLGAGPSPAGATELPAPTSMNEVGAAHPDTGRVVRGVFRSETGDRPFRLHLPPPEGEEPRPLVVVLHGCTQDAEDVARGTEMDRWAGRRHAAVLYPEQPVEANPNRCWNWYEPEHQRRGSGEPAILAGMIRRVVEERRLDPDRVYVVGISAGGAMALVLSSTYPDLVAGVASHSGIAFQAVRGMEEALAAMAGTGAATSDAVLEAMGEGRRPVPLLALHGASDNVVSPGNLEVVIHQWEGVLRRTVGEPLEWGVLAEAEGVVEGIRELRGPDGRVWLRAALLEGVGHAWSGGSPEGTFTDPDGRAASRLVVDFFLRGP